MQCRVSQGRLGDQSRLSRVSLVQFRPHLEVHQIHSWYLSLTFDAFIKKIKILIWLKSINFPQCEKKKNMEMYHLLFKYIQ